MSNNITYTLEVSFKEECHIINLPMEYPQFTGSEEWAIFSVLPEAELRVKYAAIIKRYEPFVYMTMEQYDPIFRDESAAVSYTGSTSRYHGVLRSQLAAPIRKFCRDDFTAEFIAEAMLTWTVAGTDFDELKGILLRIN